MEQDYPRGWPALVSPGDDCRALEGTYLNQGTWAKAPPIANAGSPSATRVWLTDLFSSPPGVWLVETGRLPATAVLKEDLHACDRVAIRIEPIPREARPLEGYSTHSLTISPSRPACADAAGARAPCTKLVIPKAGGHPFPNGPSNLFCPGRSLLYVGATGTWGAFNTYFAPAVDGSLVAVTSSQLLVDGPYWARFARLPE